MAKFKSTEQVLRIIKNKDQIRNFGVIAHVDHGKTTMSDSLLAHSGIIARQVSMGQSAPLARKDQQGRRVKPAHKG